MPYKILRLDINALPSTFVIGTDCAIPDFPVVYIIFDDREVFYVGATKSLYNRWSAHRNEPKLANIVNREGVKVAWLVLKTEQLGEFEGPLIRFLNPTLNSKRNGRCYHHADIVRPRRSPYQRLKRGQEERQQEI